LRSLKERAKKATNQTHETGFELALKMWNEEKAKRAKAGRWEIPLA
jgi:hypothetical protein